MTLTWFFIPCRFPFLLLVVFTPLIGGNFLGGVFDEGSTIEWHKWILNKKIESRASEKGKCFIHKKASMYFSIVSEINVLDFDNKLFRWFRFMCVCCWNLCNRLFLFDWLFKLRFSFKWKFCKFFLNKLKLV